MFKICKFSKKNLIIRFYKLSSIVEVCGTRGSNKKVFSGKVVFLVNFLFFIFAKKDLWGFVSELKNLCLGVCDGYFLEIRCVGLGYRVVFLSNCLLLKLGYSNYIKCYYRASIRFFGFKDKLILYGVHLDEIMKLGFFLREFKFPDVYKGKGLQFGKEIISLRVGKQR